MRLIEAETLKSAIREKFPSLADRCEINEVINSAQTIDAIPTDWLRGKMKEYESREFDEPGMYFRFVLWAWQKHCDEVNETEVKPKRLKDQVCGNDYCELR